VRRDLENLLTPALTRIARLLRWPATDPKLALRAWGQRFGSLRLPTSSWGLALGDSLLNWFTDAAVLTVGILAVGGHVPWHDLLLVYAAGVAAQGLSLTPGGLAITEGAISLALVASGMHVRQAVAAAVLYRLISFWFNAALGWLLIDAFLLRAMPAQDRCRACLRGVSGGPLRIILDRPAMPGNKKCMNIRNVTAKEQANAHAGQYPPVLERRSDVCDACVQRDARRGTAGGLLAQEPPQQPER